MLEAVYAEFEQRVQEILGAGTHKADAVELVVLHTLTPFQLAELVVRLPHISKTTISRTLGRMREQGLVSLNGRGRGATWSLTPRGRMTRDDDA